MAAGQPLKKGLLARLVDVQSGRRRATLASVIRSRSKEFAVGTKWLVATRGDLPSLRPSLLAESILADLAETPLTEGRCIAYDADGRRLQRARSAVLEVYYEPLAHQDRLVVVGAGHVAVPICQIADAVGFEVTVIDDRSDFANRERFPQAARVLVGEMATTLGELTVDEGTCIVLVTRAHSFDEQALHRLAGSRTPYIGMIGSRRRVMIVYRNLLNAGVTADALTNVYAPIGLDIGSRTAEEIALSIVAEIVNVKRGGKCPSLRLEQWQRYFDRPANRADQ